MNLDACGDVRLSKVNNVLRYAWVTFRVRFAESPELRDVETGMDAGFEEKRARLAASRLPCAAVQGRTMSHLGNNVVLDHI